MDGMNYEMRIQKLAIPEGCRVIITSDIHGRLSYLKGLLDKLHFTKEDYLLIAGDILEKGGESLATLHYLMELMRTHRVYAVCGNVDARIIERLETEESFVKRYQGMMRNWGNCFYEELLSGQGLTLAQENELSLQAQEMNWLKEQKKGIELRRVSAKEAYDCIRSCYEKELDFIRRLPFVIDAGAFLVTHAGIVSDREEEYKALPPDKVKEMLNWDGFQDKAGRFSRYVFVGHWPVTIYERAQMDSNPFINREKKIVSLDGGCAVKRDGQLNAVIFRMSGAEGFGQKQFEVESFDDFPTAVVAENREGSRDAFYVRWHNRHVVKLAEREKEMLVRFLGSGDEKWIPKPYLWDEGEGLSCSDYTDYEMAVKAGDRVSVLGRYGDRTIIRKDGVLGWYTGSFEKDSHIKD